MIKQQYTHVYSKERAISDEMLRTLIWIRKYPDVLQDAFFQKIDDLIDRAEKQLDE